MKSLKPLLITLSLLLCGLSTQQVSAQSVALSEKLNEFSKTYGVYFSYDVSGLKDLKTDFQINKSQPIQEALKALLTPFQIRYKMIGKQFYVLEKSSTSPQKQPIKTRQWSFQLLDDTNLAPIGDAFIFGENSSIGTNTDQDGKATLNARKLKRVNIVLTHINYETVVIPSEILRTDTTNLIFMTPKVNDLREVVIGSKKRNQRKRRQWMRRFEEAFYGETKRKNQVELLNPEVLWFEESDSLFQAHAIDYLQLVNKNTGYNMRFVLNDFKIFNATNDVKYVGQVFFEDISGEMKKQRRIHKRRDKNYLNSKNLFFKSLVQQLPINGQRFEYGVTAPTEDLGKPFQYTPLNYSQLNWRYGLDADTIVLADYLTVVNKDAMIANSLLKGRLHKVKDDEFAASFLRSKTGKFIIAKNGYLINQKDIEESGYWAAHRVANELPIDYDSPVTVDEENQQHQVIDRLSTYRYTQAPEKIFIHTNKSSYSNRENMWFKVYLVNGIDHRPQTESEVIYLDLISPEEEKIKTWMIHKDQGFVGDFTWNRNHIEGNYRLRAYTNYMRNMDASFFYEKTIPVYNFLPTEESIETQQQASITSPKLDTKMVQFFPEGGDLIAGLMANVSFRVQDSLGKAYEVNGQLLNSKGEEITSFKTYHEGVGLFNFIPERNEQYTARISCGNASMMVPLPKVFNSGWTLQVNPTSEEEIYIDVACTDPKQLEEAFLVGHVRGSVFCYIQTLTPGQAIQLSKAQIPEGILHFTLFDGQAKPQAERLVFNGDFKETPQVEIGGISATSPEARISVPLSLDENLRGEAIDASVSITNAQLTPYMQYEENIRTYLLLNSDLSDPIAAPGQYFASNDKTSRFYLDLLLMCRGWRRFNWKDLKEEKKDSSLPYIAEKGYTIRGVTTAKGNPEKRVQAEVMLNSFDQNFIYKKIQTDENGNFAFTQLPAMDSVQYILQGRINNGKLSEGNEGKVEGNRLLEFIMSSRPEIPIGKSKLQQPFFIPKFSTQQKQALVEKTNTDEVANAPAWQIDLDEVTINARRTVRNNRPDRFFFFDLDALDWIKPTTQGTSLLARLAPRYNFYPGPEGKLYHRTTNYQGQPVLIPVAISIDGMGAEPGGSNAGPFLSLTADDIKSIVITASFISVTTRGISRTMEAYLESGILQYKHPAYDQARTFYTPAYPETADKDMRTAVAWEPQVRFDEKGKASVSFITAKTPGIYHVHLEGITTNGEPISAKSQVSIQF